MYLDTSRDRFDPAKHYSAVLLQQGRVILDSDVTEQSAIWAHLMRTAITDIIGPAGAPVPLDGSVGFQVTAASSNNQPDLAISAGRAYVEGIAIEAGDGVTYLSQPDGYLDPEQDKLPTEGGYVLYLRVWERSVTALQDPGIQEVALGIHGPDTCGRAQVVWQAATWPVTDPDGWVKALKKPGEATKLWESQILQGKILSQFQPAGTLRAQAVQPEDAATNLCTVSPQAQYRGRENQHYLVEIFSGGGASGGTSSDPVARYVWSRDNGSVTFAIENLAGQEVTVASLGRDVPSSLEIGDWVEIVDDASASRVADETATGPARALFQVTAIDPLNLIVTLDRDPTGVIGTTGALQDRHPLLRRWDGGGDAAGLGAELTEGGWTDLEDGVQVMFPGSGDPAAPFRYRNGDYWLIPARTALGDVIWPQDASGPAALPPAGVAYHYAPLAFVIAGQNAQITMLLPTFSPAAHPV